MKFESAGKLYPFGRYCFPVISPNSPYFLIFATDPEEKSTPINSPLESEPVIVLNSIYKKLRYNYKESWLAK